MPITNQDLPFMPYKQSHKHYARENRKQETLPEKIVRKSMLSRKQTWYKFTRQKPIWPFILDFYCSKLKLAIEIDGESHKDQQEYDEYRTHELSKLWIQVLRFDNEDVLMDGDWVFEKVVDCIKSLELVD